MRHRVLPHPPDPSRASQLTFRRAEVSPPKPLPDMSHQSVSVALLAGVRRAGRWCGQTSELLPSALRSTWHHRFRSCRWPFPATPSVPSGRRFVHLPDESPASLASTWLPIQVEGPSDVGSSVRLRRRNLAVPVRPLQALRPASGGFPPATLPFLPLPARHEAPRQSCRSCHPRRPPLRSADTHPRVSPPMFDHGLSVRPTLRRFELGSPPVLPGGPAHQNRLMK